MKFSSAESAELMRVAARATLRYLAGSKGWERLALAEDQFHSGDDPIRADQEAHEVFAREVRGDTGVGQTVFAVVGEESIIPLPDVFTPGTRVIVVDPLDGSTQWGVLASNYCVAAYCLVAKGDGVLDMESAVVVNPQHAFTWRADASGFEYAAGPEALGVNTESVLPESSVLAPSIAFTGFKPKDRAAALALGQAFADWNVYPIGGNPATPYVVVGGLTVALTLRPQAAWDALGILISARSDAVLGALDGTILDPETFTPLFARVVLEGNVRRIPAMIVAKSRQRFDEVVERLGPIIGDGLLISPPAID